MSDPRIIEMQTAGVGSKFRDDSGDVWVKREQDTWDWEHSHGGPCYGWSSFLLGTKYTEGYVFDARPGAAPSAVEEERVTLEQVEAAVTRITGNSRTANRVVESLKRERLQTMTVTFKIPVKNLDPMGDTWQLGINEMDRHGIDLTEFEDDLDVAVSVTIEDRQ